MKIVFCCALAFLSCSDSYHLAPATGSRIVAYVHWDTQGLADKQLELLQTGEKIVTDASGTATFDVAPGTYTIRAYAINRGGPGPRNIDFEVVVAEGETARLDIVDCLPCV